MSEETTTPEVEEQKPKQDDPNMQVDERTHNDAGEKFNWYIVNSYSGHENKVANQLRQRITANGMDDEIPSVVVPIQEKIIAKGGKKKTIKERIFPGYVLVKMVMSDHTMHLIRNTDGVIGFIGVDKKPTPLNPKEVKAILSFMNVKQPSYQAAFSIGDAVKVIDGPFKDFVGSVKEINEDKAQVSVLLSIFGRETPVSLDFLQVNKL